MRLCIDLPAGDVPALRTWLLQVGGRTAPAALGDLPLDEAEALVKRWVAEAVRGADPLTFAEAARRLGIVSKNGERGLIRALAERVGRDAELAACVVQARRRGARRVDPAKLAEYIARRVAPVLEGE